MTSNPRELLELGRVDEALAVAAQRLAADPGDVPALATMARVALMSGQASQLQSLMSRLRMKGATEELLLLEAVMALGRKDWTRAYDLYERLLEGPSPSAEVWYGMGVVLLALEDLESAQQALERSLELKPGQPSVYFELGRLRVMRGEARLAVREFVRVLRQAPQDVRAWMAVAEVMARRRKPRQALRVVERGLRELPGNHVLLGARALLTGKTPVDAARAERIRAYEREVYGRRLVAKVRFPASGC